ncbi:CCA tRNA nucleotidyltransferase [Pigmentiphaga litoralis]|uniref:CCA tRNA nucleotidyltransferase n=1 Tax=Pigmentiphaga litoralis TaxID=516702 RepID=UPI003B42BA82
MAAADPALDGLDVYVVGGAVRDALLGLPAGDRDWVVVGATPEQLSDRGFLPVGGDFPVFLHPATREEYALARTERKSGRGYKGFTFHTGPEVTLEDDLGRRDLTVNAIARHADGRLVDPYGGQRDLADRVFRHVGPAFSEDPVRVLRLARFAARFTDFSIAPETLALCRHMVDDGEVDALVPERVWKELARGLMLDQPSRMLDVLADTHALPRVAPGLVWTPRVADLIDRAARNGLPLAGRYALLCVESSDTAALAKRLRTPTECADQARLLQSMLKMAEAFGASPSAEQVISLFELTDALRKPDRLSQLLDSAALILPVERESWRNRWLDWLDVARTVDAGAIAARHAKTPALIKDAVRTARRDALERHLAQDSPQRPQPQNEPPQDGHEDEV